MVAPASILFYLPWLSVLALAACLVGTAVGWATSLAFRTGARGLGIDAILGVTGFFGGFVFASALPWRGCYDSDGWTLCNMFPYVWQVAWATAILLPVVHQMYRFKVARARAMTGDLS